MELTKGEIAFLAGQFPEKTIVSLFSNIRADTTGAEAESLEKKGLTRGGVLIEGARELLEVIAGASNSARILLQDQFAFVEKYVFRHGKKYALVESNGEILALNPLMDMDRVLLELTEFTGISRLKTVDLEIALLPEEMLVLLALVDIYRKNTLLFHAGEAELIGSAKLLQIARVLQSPEDNSFVRILIKNYGYPVPPEAGAEEILKKLVAKGYLGAEKGYHLREELEAFARNSLIPGTLLLTEALQADPSGGVAVGGGLAVVSGHRDIAYFILENDMVELSTPSGRQLMDILEKFLNCPDLAAAGRDGAGETDRSDAEPSQDDPGGSPPPDQGHAAPPDRNFAALSGEYRRLSEQHRAGAISGEEFQDKVNQLRFQDSGSVWWQLSTDGAWLRWDGANWVEAAPAP